MCWPRVEGGLEIEERYPRTNDPREPRRKRLNFVRDRSSPRRSSDDYALVRSSFHQTRPIRAEMQERHDPHLLQQQDMYMRQLQGENQELQHRLRLEEEQRRRFLIEQARQNHGHPPPPPPPPRRIDQPHEQQRIMHHPHEGYPDGVEPVEQWQPHPRPHIVEVQPRSRSRMPNHLHHAISACTQMASHDDDIVAFTGRCHCGAVRYVSSSAPQNLTYCYCRACRHLSGGPFIAWVDILLSAFRLDSPTSETGDCVLKPLSSDVAVRSICNLCGSSVTMKYFCEETIGVAAGTIDEKGCAKGGDSGRWRIKEHIFLREKTEWFDVPDDGAKRWAGFSEGFEEKLEGWRKESKMAEKEGSSAEQ
ncbi:MAG: hypothetical protein Q9185_000584 [Variospora sp. 1 TL-2023]